MNFTRKPIAVEAWQFTGQPIGEWPTFVTDYSVYTATGTQKVVPNNFGGIFVPKKGSINYGEASKGDWLVLENGVLSAVKGYDFVAQFEPLAEDAPEA